MRIDDDRREEGVFRKRYQPMPRTEACKRISNCTKNYSFVKTSSFVCVYACTSVYLYKEKIHIGTNIAEKNSNFID